MAANNPNSEAKNQKTAGNLGSPREGVTKPLSPTHQAELAGQAGFAQQAGNSHESGNQEQIDPLGNSSTAADAQPGESNRSAKSTLGFSSNALGPGNERFITHVDPKSALKVGFAFNLAVFAIWVVAMVLLWIVLNVAGVWGRLNSLAGDLADGKFSAGLYFGTVFGLGLFELVIFTLLAPVAAVVFNSATTFFGGLRIGVEKQIQPAGEPTQEKIK